MKIAVFGLGGVGGYFGGRLAQTAHEVYFIARGAHLQAIQQNGLYVESESGDFIATPTLATHDPAAVGAVDFVVVATKTWQVAEAAAAMRPLVGEQTSIIPLLNGVEAPMQLAEFYGERRVLGGFCRVMSHIVDSGKVHQSGVTPFVAFGELDQRPSTRVEQLRAIFAEAGVMVEATPDIQAAMWQKLLFIASLSGVGSVTRAAAGIIRSLPQTRQMLLDCMGEIVAVAQARGVGLAADAVEKGMSYVDNLPESATASMQRDVMEGRPSELEAQNGAVVRLGAEVGVAAPTHAFIYASLLPGEMQARGQNRL